MTKPCCGGTPVPAPGAGNPSKPVPIAFTSSTISPAEQRGDVFAMVSNVARAGYSYLKIQLGAGYTNKKNYKIRRAVCEGCKAVDRDGKPLYRLDTGIPYCGVPFADNIVRTPELDGCGCNLSKKWWTASEECPLKLWLPIPKTEAKKDK